MSQASDNRPYRSAFELLGIEAEDPREVFIPGRLPGLELSNPKDMDIKVLSFGENKVLSIDNFFRDPEATRKFAFSLEYKSEAAAVSSLRARFSESQLGHTKHIEDFCGQLVMDRILDIPGTPVQLFEDSKKTNAPSFNFSVLDRMKARRLAKSSETSPFHERMLDIGAPHIDSVPYIWYNLIVHLTLPGYNPGGTAFFRHKETNLQSFLMYDWQFSQKLQEAHGARFFDKMVEALRERDEVTLDQAYTAIRGALPVEDWFAAESNEMWDCIGTLAAAFNRAYVFPSWQFHAEYMESDELDLSSFERARHTFNNFLRPYAVL